MVAHTSAQPLACVPEGCDTDQLVFKQDGTSHSQKLSPRPPSDLECRRHPLFLSRCTVPFKSRLVPPKWVPAAWNLRTSSHFICRKPRALDIVNVSL